MTQDFDRWLERELNRTLTPMLSQPARPGQARYQTIQTRRLSMPRKVVVGLAAATMALAGGTAVYAATATGSLNPLVWGQHVKSAVASCKAELQQGNGIGACVSAFARQHGEEMRTQHGAPGLDHGRRHPGPPGLRQPASPEASTTANP